MGYITFGTRVELCGTNRTFTASSNMRMPHDFQVFLHPRKADLAQLVHTLGKCVRNRLRFAIRQPK